MLFKELILQCDFEDVWRKLSFYYPNQVKSHEKFREVYEKLRSIDPLPNETDMYIYIKILQEDPEGDVIFATDFIEDDADFYFDVCGKDNEWDCYSLVANLYGEWLGYFVDEESLHRMTFENFVAHCLYEMTFITFEDTSSVF